MTEPGDQGTGTPLVGVLVSQPLADDDRDGHPDDDRGRDRDVRPGYDETSGGAHRRRPSWSQRFVVDGEDAVREAASGVGRLVGLVAQQVAAGLDHQEAVSPQRLGLSVDTIEVTFGVTFEAGVKALVSTQTETSAQVKLTLTRSGTSDR